MDEYLQEQQKKIEEAKHIFANNILAILLYFIQWLAIAAVLTFITFLIGALLEMQDVDEYVHTKIVLAGNLTMAGGKGGSSTEYIIQDEDGNRYQVGKKNYNRVAPLLENGKTYELVYCSGILGYKKHARVLKDADQTYFDMSDTESDFYQSNKIFIVRLKTLKNCIIISVALAFMIHYAYSIYRGIKTILRYKRHIRYYLQHGVPLIVLDRLDIEVNPNQSYDNLTTEEVGQLLQHHLLAAKLDYRVNIKVSIVLCFLTLLATGVSTYTCWSALAIAGTPTAVEWQTKEIVFAEISKESYYRNFNYYCICDQEGNKYALTTASEYRYFDLQEQLQSGHSYQIVYGANKYINRQMFDLYQLNDSSATHVSAAEARYDIQKSQKHQRNLNIFCLIFNSLIVGFYCNWLRKLIKINKNAIAYCEGRIVFYQRTGIILPFALPVMDDEENSKTEAVANAEEPTETKAAMASGEKPVAVLNKTAGILDDEAAADSAAEEKPAFQKYEPVITFTKDEDAAVRAAAPAFYQNHFAAEKLLFVLAGLVLAIMGGYYAYNGVLLVFVPQDTTKLYNISLLLQGIMMTVLGLWLMFIFRSRTVEIPEGAIVAYEAVSILIGGWVCYFALIGITALNFWFFSRKFFNYTDFTAAMFIIIASLYFTFLLFGCYRNRRLILHEGTIESVTFLGNRSYYESHLIAGMEKTTMRVKMLDADGEEMFSLHPNMIQAQEIFLALGGDKYYKYESNDDHADK